jgi:hypothetical protein
MRFIPDEIVGTLAYGDFAGLEGHGLCRVRLNNCDGSFAEELIVSIPVDATELVRALRLGDRVCVRFWLGEAIGIKQV